jgi:hypothetical protein
MAGTATGGSGLVCRCCAGRNQRVSGWSPFRRDRGREKEVDSSEKSAALTMDDIEKNTLHCLLRVNDYFQ